jgi:uncharacterized protein (DUF362 family)
MPAHRELGLTRRQFVAAGTGLAAGLLGGGSRLAWARASAPPPRRARVGVASDARVWGPSDALVATGVDHLLDRALARALGGADGAAALATRFAPADVVGIKVNCLAGRGLSTHIELVQSLTNLLVRAGVRADNIIVWDRSDRDLARARYGVRRTGDGPRCFGTNDDYEPEPIEAGAVAGCLSRILTRRISALINVPVLKDHDLAGISGALKSFYGAIHNPNRYHDHACTPYVADLNTHPAIRSKLRLTVFDALRPQFHGGPAYDPAYGWPLGRVFVSTDPVAADVVALRLLEEKRAQEGLPSLERSGRAPAWLPLAAKLGLGVGDPALIDEVSA